MEATLPRLEATMEATLAKRMRPAADLLERSPWSEQIRSGWRWIAVHAAGLVCGGSGIRTHGGQDPHTLSKRADSAALASLRGRPGPADKRRGQVPPRGAEGIVWLARDSRWRPGPVQLKPVNRGRAGRQKLSAEPVV